MTRARLAALAAVLALGLPGARPASAEVLRLKTGETIKGRVVAERSTEAFLVVEDFATGAVREIAWPAVVEADRERWLEALGIEDKKGAIEVECDVVTYRIQGGTDVVTGKVESEPGADPLRVRAGGRTVSIERSRVVSVEKGTCEATEIFTPEELAAQKLEEVNPQTARDWFRLGRFDEKVGAYEEAKAAYESAASDPEFLYAEQARRKVDEIAAILRDREAFDTLRDAKLKLSSRQFARVREILEGFFEKHPEAGEAVRKAVETAKEQFAKEREKAMAKAAGDAFPKLVRRLIRARVKDKDVKLTEVQSWAKRTLPEEAMAELAGKSHLGRLDSAVTPEEARTFWDARPKRDWKRVSYGAGTFVVEPPKVKPPSRRSGGGGGGSSGGVAVQVEIPKPPTRDSWWEKENVDRREDWVFAQFVENSGLFDVHPKKDKSPCDVCVGSGLLHKMLSGGGQLSYLCTRCAGAQFDLTVRYR
jgi:hypothetical protein